MRPGLKAKNNELTNDTSTIVHKATQISMFFLTEPTPNMGSSGNVSTGPSLKIVQERPKSDPFYKKILIPVCNATRSHGVRMLGQTTYSVSV